MSWFQETEIAIVLALGLLAAPLVVAAQEEPAAGFEGMIEISEVLLDVLAVDRSGRIVSGLGKGDFLIEENGEPVEVTARHRPTARRSRA